MKFSELLATYSFEHTVELRNFRFTFYILYRRNLSLMMRKETFCGAITSFCVVYTFPNANVIY